MSELTEEQKIAQAAERKAAQDAANAEMKATVDKYTALAGKSFTKDGKEIVTIVRYAGVHTIHGGVRAHLLEVEVKGIRAWTPVASKFLEEYTEVKTTETATSKII